MPCVENAKSIEPDRFDMRNMQRERSDGFTIPIHILTLNGGYEWAPVRRKCRLLQSHWYLYSSKFTVIVRMATAKTKILANAKTSMNAKAPTWHATWKRKCVTTPKAATNAWTSPQLIMRQRRHARTVINSTQILSNASVSRCRKWKNEQNSINRCFSSQQRL